MIDIKSDIHPLASADRVDVVACQGELVLASHRARKLPSEPGRQSAKDLRIKSGLSGVAGSLGDVCKEESVLSSSLKVEDWHTDCVKIRQHGGAGESNERRRNGENDACKLHGGRRGGGV